MSYGNRDVNIEGSPLVEYTFGSEARREVGSSIVSSDGKVSSSVGSSYGKVGSGGSPDIRSDG